MKGKLRDRIAPLWFLFPNFVGFLVFTAGPIVYSFGASFSNSNLQHTITTRFIGFENFTELFGDTKFWLSMLNTLYLMIGLPFSIAFSLWIAVLLNRKMRGNQTLKAIL